LFSGKCRVFALLLECFLSCVFVIWYSLLLLIVFVGLWPGDSVEAEMAGRWLPKARSHNVK
jgi:hypothetical protein